jgi:hypothetical protein
MLCCHALGVVSYGRMTLALYCIYLLIVFVHSVERALIADIGRIENEVDDYHRTNQNEALKMTNWKLALQVMGDNILTQASELPETAETDRRREALLMEIQVLHDACQSHEEEVSRLETTLKDQACFDRQLDVLVYALEADLNALDLQARAFDNNQNLLFRTLVDGLGEVHRLCSPQVELLPVLFHLQIDKQRGLRYPLINELRLAYKPKGDVGSDEIQAAWSLAAQLLLTIGTLFDFQSPQWRIVPLSHCAKLLYYPLADGNEVSSERGERRRFEAHELGGCGNESKSLMMWNKLMHLVVHHVMVKVHESTESGLLGSESLLPLPYEISETKIGDIVLNLLGESDDAGWSRTIHYMISVLEWLLECSKVFMLQTSRLLADSTGIEMT